MSRPRAGLSLAWPVWPLILSVENSRLNGAGGETGAQAVAGEAGRVDASGGDALLDGKRYGLTRQPPGGDTAVTERTGNTSASVGLRLWTKRNFRLNPGEAINLDLLVVGFHGGNVPSGSAAFGAGLALT